MANQLRDSASFGLTDEIVASIVRTILRHGEVDRILLFGSRTRGDFDDRSDIDLAIEGRADPLLLRGYLEEEVPTLRRFDVVRTGDLDAAMASSVKQEGIVLYDKTQESTHEFRTGA